MLKFKPPLPFERAVVHDGESPYRNRCFSPGLGPAQPLKEILIGSSNISYTNFSTFYARDRKFFEKEGLSPKIIVVKTEAALPAMATGQLDYTTLTTSTIEAALVGMPLRLVAVANQQPLWGVVAAKELHG